MWFKYSSSFVRCSFCFVLTQSLQPNCRFVELPSPTQILHIWISVKNKNRRFLKALTLSVFNKRHAVFLRVARSDQQYRSITREISSFPDLRSGLLTKETLQKPRSANIWGLQYMQGFLCMTPLSRILHINTTLISLIFQWVLSWVIIDSE